MMRINHIGYLVKKIDKAVPAFLQLGFEQKGEMIFDEFREANLLFLEKDGYVIELVSPVSKTSVVANLIKRLGNCPYHICYETDDIKQVAGELQAGGYVLLDEPHPAVAFDNRNVCFLVHPYLGMIELLEI